MQCIEIATNHRKSEYDKVSAEYESWKAKGLKLNMARGKPSKQQLDLVSGILTALTSAKECVDSGVDARNYGELKGLESARKLFADILGCKTSQVFAGGNSSLQLMYDTVSKAYTHGLLHSEKPWCKEASVKWLCPAPGYGEPGGTCVDCVLNQFGSDGNNKGKACKNMRMLYLLRSGEYMPIQIALPPTSLTPYTRFVNEAFLSRRRKVCTGVVRIGLKKAVSGSHEYCVATFTKIADFAGEDLAHIRAYADGFVAQIKDINAQRAQAGAAASSIIGDGDASHLELPDNGAHFALGAVIDGEREELPA